jgi:hypothetical protein
MGGPATTHSTRAPQMHEGSLFQAPFAPHDVHTVGSIVTKTWSFVHVRDLDARFARFARFAR